MGGKWERPTPRLKLVIENPNPVKTYRREGWISLHHEYFLSARESAILLVQIPFFLNRSDSLIGSKARQPSGGGFGSNVRDR